MNFKVKFGNVDRTVECTSDRTILNAAIRAGVDYPYGCASGNCGLCISTLDSGEVDLLPHGDGALSIKQKASGLTLACRARPRSDIAIRWLGSMRPE